MFEVPKEPKHLMVVSGEFQVINCTANCTDPKKLVLETALHKTLLEGQAQWKLFKVVNISENVELLCSFTCGGRQEMKVFIITVFCECRPRALLPRPEPGSAHRAALSLLLGTVLWSPPPWAPGSRPRAQNLLTPSPGLLEPCHNQDFEICSEADNPSKL